MVAKSIEVVLKSEFSPLNLNAVGCLKYNAKFSFKAFTFLGDVSDSELNRTGTLSLAGI